MPTEEFLFNTSGPETVGKEGLSGNNKSATVDKKIEKDPESTKNERVPKDSMIDATTLKSPFDKLG